MQGALSSGEIMLIISNIDEVILSPPALYGNTGNILYGTQHLYAQSNVSGTTTGALEFMWNIEDEELQKSGCIRVITEYPNDAFWAFHIYMPIGTGDRRLIDSFWGAYEEANNVWQWHLGLQIAVEDNYTGNRIKNLALQYKVNEETSMLETTGYVYIWSIDDWANTPYIITNATDYSIFDATPQVMTISIYCQSLTHPTYFSNLRFTTYETGFLPYLGKGYPPRLRDLSEYLSNQSYTVIY